MSATTSYVALLRGVNVGGKGIISMSLLKEMVAKLGHQQVATYINSGNVIFRTKTTSPRLIEKAMEQALGTHFATIPKVVVLSAHDLQHIANHLPKNWKDNKDIKCNIIFLHHSIDKASIVDNFTLKPELETVVYHPGVLLWSAKWEGITRSAMLKLNSSPLYQYMTVRNPNTVRKLCAMLQTMDGD